MTDSDWLQIERRAQELKWGRGDYAGSLRLRLELEERHRQIGAGAEVRTKNLNLLAHVAVHAGALDEAERAARKCLELYRPLAADRDERLATYLMMLSAVLAESRKFDEAAGYGDEAVAIFAQTHGTDDSFVDSRRMDIERMRDKDTRPYLDR